MAGGLISIATYGSNDLYLTGAPQITFFKVVYRRYTNFSVESIKILIDDNLDFNKESEVTLPKIGDLIYKTYLELNIPEVVFTTDDIGIDHEDAELDTSPTENYDTVIQFMKLNSNAYREAVSSYVAVNTTVSDMFDAIKNVFTSAEIDESGGASVSDIINAYTTLVNSFVDSGKLERLLTNIEEVIELVQESPDLTKDSIIIRVKKAIDNSIKVQEFFFNEMQTAQTTYDSANSKAVKFAWVKRLGHAIVDYIDVYIGGEKIDRHFGDWMNIWYELTGNKDKDDLYSRMIGDVKEMTTFDQKSKPQYKLTIPLQFWFTRHNGLAFPLIAMQYNEILFKLKLKKLEDCAYLQKIVDDDVQVSLSSLWEDKGYFLTGYFVIDYIFLDSLERKKFAQSAHEYLIETVQVIEIGNIDTTKQHILFDFNHPCKEIIWTVQKETYINNDTSFKKSLWDNYSISGNNKGNCIERAKLELNGFVRFENYEGSFFNYVEPYKRHRNTPSDGVNVYSFALNPEEPQPSGSCNFSMIGNSKLYLTIDSRAFVYNRSDIEPYIEKGSDDDTEEITTVKILVFATNYNILRLVGGYAAKAYN